MRSGGGYGGTFSLFFEYLYFSLSNSGLKRFFCYPNIQYLFFEYLFSLSNSGLILPDFFLLSKYIIFIFESFLSNSGRNRLFSFFEIFNKSTSNSIITECYKYSYPLSTDDIHGLSMCVFMCTWPLTQDRSGIPHFIASENYGLKKLPSDIHSSVGPASLRLF